MTLSQLGPYPIEREVGRGGMGVVYLGRDTRLQRPVAIKVLPEAFARDPERLARFEREARLLASLTHPNIAGIYGIEEADGKRFLALEYVEGETLADHLVRGALSLEESLDVCRQIATALETAHEAGIVHRDLKPGNVKLTPAGDVKVLDFGLAKGMPSSADSSPDLTQSPTLTHAATGVGVVLGTAAYMSPEQARGKVVDRRTDIWSFGCVLYECLSGRQAFAGETVSDMIALILQGEPDWSQLPAKTPEKVRALIARCLEKDARRRLRDIGDARVEIEDVQRGRDSGSRGAAVAPSAGAAAAGSPARPPRLARTLGIGAVLVAVGAAAAVVALNLSPGARREAAPYRFTLSAPAGLELTNDPNEQAISPDGRMLAFAAIDSSGNLNLWLRPLGDFQARVLPGTRSATLPFWSPDSRQLGFFSDGKLRRIRVNGGNPELICDAPSGRGATWGVKDVIVFSPAPAGPLFKVRASGGTPEPVTVVDTTRGENAHRWPSFLPDGERFIFVSVPPRKGQFESFVGSIESRPARPLIASSIAPIYAAPGYLIFTRNDALMAQRFDTRKLKVSGDPFAIGEPPASTTYFGAPGASVSTNGVLSWQGSGDLTTRLAWLDRQGREIQRIGIPPDRWSRTAISRDGRRALIEQEVATGNTDLWVVDLEREVVNRLAYNQGRNFIGVWSPDNHEIIYNSNRRGPRDLYRRAADGSGSDRVFYQSEVPYKDATDWSPDGKWIVMQHIGDATGWNLSLLPAAGGPPVPYLASPFNEQFGLISPDGRWMTYTSDESGSDQVYVQSFPEPGRKQQITRTGGLAAFWTSDGRELCVLRPDLAASVMSVESGAELKLGASRELFRAPPNTRSLEPHPDGQRFLQLGAPTRETTGISVAIDWRAGKEE